MVDLFGDHLGFAGFPSTAKSGRAYTAGARWATWGEEWRWHLESDGYTVDTASLVATVQDVWDEGLNTVVGFMGPPPNVTGTSADGHYFPTTDAGRLKTIAAASDYASSLSAAATTAGKQCILKLSNELNQPQFDTAGASVLTKARFIQAAMLGARAGAPDMGIAGFSVAARGDMNNPADVAAQITAPHFVRAMFDALPDLYTNAALKPHYVCMHPYSYGSGAATTKGWGGWVQLDALRLVLDEYGWDDVPLLVTEVGHPSGPTASNALWTPERQVTEIDLIMRHILYREAVGHVAFPAFIFTQDDYDGGTGNDLGLSTSDGTPKPAWDMFRLYAAMDLDPDDPDPPPPPDPPIGWGSLTDGWESETIGWGTVGTVPPGPPYTPIPDPRGTRRGPIWAGAASTYRPTPYSSGPLSGFGPFRSVTTTQLLEMDGVAVRSSTVRFDVLDRGLNPIGTLDVSGAPKVANDTTRTIKRTLDGLTVDPVAAVELDAIRARLRPTVILEDGSEWPLGVFLFVDATRQALTVGREFSGSLHDQLFMADQPTDQTVSYRRGKNLGDILQEQAEQVGFPVISVDATNRAASKPLAWPAGTHRLKILEEVATMAGMFSPYCTNAGVFRCRKIGTTDLGDTLLRYNPGGRVIADSAAESDDLLDAPNRYIVIDDSSTDEPIVGSYDVPRSSPVSVARRGFAVADVQTLQGLDGPDAANEAAQANATNAGLGYELVSFDAVPDYRHDTFDSIVYEYEVWAETVWELECSPTAVMHHEARKVYS